MNLHGIASTIISAVNPLVPVSIRVSVGQGAATPDGSYPPAYATPGSFSGSIAGNVLTVTSVSSGVVQIGQTLADTTSALLQGTSVVADMGGGGGPGTYEVSVQQTVALEAMTTTSVLPSQIQPISTRDLTQLDGINLGGVHWKIYLDGQLDGIVRPELKGGDLIVIPPGIRHAGTWLVVQVMEQFPDWVCAAIVIQNGV